MKNEAYIQNSGLWLIDLFSFIFIGINIEQFIINYRTDEKIAINSKEACLLNKNRRP